MDNARALQIVDVSHWQLNFINGHHFVFKVQDDTIFFHGFDTQNNVTLWLINLLVLNNIRCRKIPLAMRILKEVQLYFSLLCGLKPPIQSIP
jgi:hypothetical protein